MPDLNPQQLEAVKTIDRPLLVLAGAGSGKTRVITEKIAWLIKQGMPARHIAALTFTNKAAREMKSRVGKLLDSKQARGLTVSTFHSLGLDILRKEHATLGFKATISIWDEQDKNALLRELIKHKASIYIEDQLDNYAWQIGHWKNAFITPHQASKQARLDEQATALLYADYTHHMKTYNTVDFDDLILLPVLLFQDNPSVLEKWQNRIRYLLVDEYQDTNLTQYQLVKLLTGTLGKLTVVGDDDQSIYSWRGAQPENLAQLQTDYPRLKVIKLEQNYRSSQRILKVANQLIANNPHTFEKRLWSEHSFGEAMRVLSHKGAVIEAQQIASDIIHHKFKTGGQFHQYAILYRGNHQARPLEKALREYKIPYFISGGTSFFSHTEVKDVLCYLRLMVNPDDDAAFLRIINTPRREIGPNTLEKLGQYANRRQISLFSACFEMGLSEFLSEPARQRLQHFCNWLNQVADETMHGNTFEAIRKCLQTIQYEKWLQDNSSSDEQAKRKIRNVDDLLSWLERLADDNGQQLSLAEIVAKILLLDIMERNSEDEVEDQVTLITLHAAKGLEFPHVYLIGFEENILPHQNSIDTGQVEEERRLAYVGITRAQRTLTFSYCSHRKRYGEITQCQPSRFLDELPQEDLERKTNIDPAVKKERGRASLAQLKNILN